MTCPSHHAIATHAENGWPLCSRCFREAREKAEDEALERDIARIRARAGFGRKS